MMRELMRVIKESEHSFIEWSKMETLGIPSVDKYYVNTDDLEEAINNAIDNNTMSLEDIAKLENVLTLMEVMLWLMVVN